MTPLGPANRHPAIPQKLPTSRQPTPPAAPASALPLSSTLIAPSPLSLNLPYINPPSQTGDSHLVAYTTIDSNRKEKVQYQQGQDIGRPTSTYDLVIKVTQSLAISPSHWGFVLKMRSPTRAGGCVWKYSPLSECCNINLFQHTATTVDTVIPSSSTLVDRPPSLLPFPIDDQGQPLFSPESTYSHTGQVPINEDSEEAIFAVQKTGSPVVKGNDILHTPVSPHLAHSSFFSPFRSSDSQPSFTSTRFDDGILPTPHFSTHLLSLSSLRRSGSFPTRSGPPQQASSTPVARSSPSTLGAHPLSFSSLPSPQFSPSSPHPSPFLADIACHYVSLCRSLIFLPPPSLLFPSATGEST